MTKRRAVTRGKRKKWDLGRGRISENGGDLGGEGFEIACCLEFDESGNANLLPSKHFHNFPSLKIGHVKWLLFREILVFYEILLNNHLLETL